MMRAEVPRTNLADLTRGTCNITAVGPLCIQRALLMADGPLLQETVLDQLAR